MRAAKERTVGTQSTDDSTLIFYFAARACSVLRQKCPIGTLSRVQNVYEGVKYFPESSISFPIFLRSKSPLPGFLPNHPMTLFPRPPPNLPAYPLIVISSKSKEHGPCLLHQTQSCQNPMIFPPQAGSVDEEIIARLVSIGTRIVTISTSVFVAVRLALIQENERTRDIVVHHS
jgi:hypothetical protein